MQSLRTSLSDSALNVGVHPFLAAAPPITCPNCNCQRTRYDPASYRRSFFRRSRLFFREAAFSSGGEGCEWGAKQPTVSSEWGYNGENSFSALSPFGGSRKGFSPHIHASRLFVLFHPTQATIPPKPTIPLKPPSHPTPSLQTSPNQAAAIKNSRK